MKCITDIRCGDLIDHLIQPVHVDNRMQFHVIGRVKRLIQQIATGLLILAPMVAQAMDFATFSNACAQNGYGAAIVGGVYQCVTRTGGGGAQPNYNAIYQQQQAAAAQQQAAAEEQRRKNAELEQQRIEADNKRRMEEIAKQAKFIDERDAAPLRGSTGVLESGGLRESGLRGSGATTELRGLKPDTRPIPNSDPMVVDARNVPTGLPKSVAAKIPHTPAGDRVRKGFEAVMDHDWKVAHAWFQDALNHDPGNTGIQRLIDLAEFTMKYEKTHPQRLASSAKPLSDTTAQDKTAITALGQQRNNRMDDNLAQAIINFNREYLPKHPELLKPLKSSAAAQNPKPVNSATGSATPEPQPTLLNANWKAFFDGLFKTPPRQGSVAAVRG